MEQGTAFLKSRIARRFCLLFILCAFVPTVALVEFSYDKVVDQLEKQSLIRLKREAKAYGLALFDRMIRIDNDLQAIGRNVQLDRQDFSEIEQIYGKDLGQLFVGISLITGSGKLVPIFGQLNEPALAELVTTDILSRDKPFILTQPLSGKSGRVFFGVNIKRDRKISFSLVGEVKHEHFWGVGSETLLPPMTDLSVYDSNGNNLIGNENSLTGRYRDLPAQYSSKEPGVYRFEKDDKVVFASTTNLFIESRFQKTGWIIILSQARHDMMSSLDSFKRSFPLVMLLLLLVILYLSVVFIRKNLEPMEKLKAGTRRIAAQDFSTIVDIKSNDEFEELGESFNEMALKLENQFQALTMVGEIERAILSSFDRSKILATTLHGFMEFFHCDLVLLAKNSATSADHVKVYVTEGRRKNDPRMDYFILNEGEQEKLFVDTDHFILSENESRPSFLARIDGDQFADLLCLPLKVEGTINRVLLLGWKKNHLIRDDEIKRARQIANQLAIALNNSRLMENMENLAMGTVEALARTVDAKSKWTAGHSERVAVLGGRIAKTMGIAAKEIDTITRGGLLHDIGKVGIPLAILNKPDSLDEREIGEIRNHPAIGAKILEPIKAYQDILPLVIHHHEKYDGSGYPDGLKGEEIDIRARILTVADVWDALVSDRPYRAGWIHDRAKKMIIDGSGTHFDPQVVEAFLAVMADA